MKNYRLKSEAVKFFKKDLSCKIFDLETWTKTYNVDERALEEVEDCFVSFGHKTDTGTSLSGWGNPDDERLKTNKGAHFHFTLHFPSMKYQEYDVFNKGKITRELMDNIQRVANQFYHEFNNNPNNKQQ